MRLMTSIGVPGRLGASRIVSSSCKERFVGDVVTSGLGDRRLMISARLDFV